MDNGSGGVGGVKAVTVEWTKDPAGRWKMEEVEGTEKVIGIRWLEPDKTWNDDEALMLTSYT